MTKVPYLIGAGSDQKFKRNVPKDLRGFADVSSAWVERPKGHVLSDLKRQGHLFAVRTDAAIKLAKMKREAQSVPPSNAARLALDDQSAKELAILYFHKLDQELSRQSAYEADPDNHMYQEQLADASEAGVAAILAKNGVERRTDQKVLRFLAESGLLQGIHVGGRYDPQILPKELAENPAFGLLCRYVERADKELTRRVFQSLDTGTLPPIADSLFLQDVTQSQISQKLKGKTVADLKRTFLKFKTDQRVTVSRISQFQIAFRVLEEFFGVHCVLSTITRQQCREIASFLPRIPAYAAQHYKGMKLLDAAAAFEVKHGAPESRSKEAAKCLAVMSQAFQFAISEDWIVDDPFKGIKVPASKARQKKHIEKGQKYHPFSIDELKKIFEAPLYVGCEDDMNGFNTPGPNRPRRHRFWAPVIALFSGMRMNEVLQLEKGDLQQEEGIWFFAVTDEEEIAYDPTTFEKRVKNVSAVRDIPVHPFLIELGFVSWVQGRTVGRIFPEATQGQSEKPSNLFSKRFATFLKSKNVGVWQPRRKVFHSFRGTFNDALRNGLVDVSLREAMNGWQQQQSMDRHYGRGHKIRILYEAIVKVNYDVPALLGLLSRN